MGAIVVAPRRRLAALGLGAAVLALHLALWPVADRPPLAAARPAVQVRVLPAPVVPLPAAVPPKPVRPLVPRVPEAAVQAADELPIYRTKLAPAFSLSYAVSRGDAEGEAILQWEPDGEGGYVLRFSGSLGGRTRLDWTSRGRVDATGLAPERYVVRGRSAHAANFERTEGRISYSGPAVERPLPPGAQDGLSWLLQLAAVVDADPARFARPGERVSLYVSGARGEAGIWHFQVQGPDGDALKLLHEPARLAEPRAEVWLDPARGYLPVLVRLGYGAAPPLVLRLAVIPRLENCVEGSICRR